MTKPITLKEVVAQRFGYSASGRTGTLKPISLAAIEIHRLMAVSSLSGQDVQSIAEVIPVSIVADAIGTTPGNIGKVYLRANIRKTQTSQLVDMSETYSKIRMMFDDDPELVHEFLNSPIPALDGECPAALLADISGRDAVESILEKMAYGDLS